jgi:hypothetical protein
MVADTQEPEVDPGVRQYIHDAAAGAVAVPSPFPRLDMACALVDLRTTPKRNGATYVVVFEVPVYFATPLAMMPDGLKMRFTIGDGEIVEIGDGGELKSMALSKDPDGGRHLKCKFQLPSSALDSASPLAVAAKEDRVTGMLLLEATQGTFDLTQRA